jgi:hypothetical protein
MGKSIGHGTQVGVKASRFSNALFANVPSDVAQLRLDTLWLW